MGSISGFLTSSAVYASSPSWLLSTSVSAGALSTCGTNELGLCEALMLLLQQIYCGLVLYYCGSVFTAMLLQLEPGYTCLSREHYSKRTAHHVLECCYCCTYCLYSALASKSQKGFLRVSRLHAYPLGLMILKSPT